MPQDAAHQAAADAWAALQDTPFGPPDHGIDVYVTGGGWRGMDFSRLLTLDAPMSDPRACRLSPPPDSD